MVVSSRSHRKGGAALKDILLSLQNYLLSDAIKTALQSSTEFRVQVIEKASEIAETCRIVRPAVLLMENRDYDLMAQGSAAFTDYGKRVLSGKCREYFHDGRGRKKIDPSDQEKG